VKILGVECHVDGLPAYFVFCPIPLSRFFTH
jgi:hypothetical protein